MLELGDHAQQAHENVGKLAAECADVLLAFGPSRECMRTGAMEAGMTQENTGCFETREQMAESLRQNCRPGDVLLFKGSHGAHMELVLEQFLK
jgi:UDP-N-acetylmuramyl pentapeptide synthase